MTGTTEHADGPPDGTSGGAVRIRCQADRRVHDIDVEWMKGAVFEFDSEAVARAWVEDQNDAVPGRLYLETATSADDGIPVDYHLKYTA